MKKIIQVMIKREDPLAGRGALWETYKIYSAREMTILEILNEIYENLDSTLAFRPYRCGRRICRSCEVKLDGKIVRGCATLLSPGRNYLLEPAQEETLIKDLVFDFSTIILD